MDVNSVLAKLKNREFSPVYLLFGEESYYIDLICDAIEDDVLNEMEKEFNQTVLYGRDVTMPDVINTAKRYPMLSDYQVVIVKEAQDLRNFFGKSTDKQNLLVNYLEHPLDSTILVFCFKNTSKIDSRKKTTKLIKEKGVLFESKRISDYKLADWISNYVRKRGYRIDALSSQLIAEHVGSDLTTITNELEKVYINLPDGGVITGDEIEENIGISKTYNIFEMQHALASKNVSKINKIALFYRNNANDYPIFMLIPMLLRFYAHLLMYLRIQNKNSAAAVLGIPPFQIKEYQQASRYYGQKSVVAAIALLRDYDLKAKGVGSAQKPGNLCLELFARLSKL